MRLARIEHINDLIDWVKVVQLPVGTAKQLRIIKLVCRVCSCKVQSSKTEIIKAEIFYRNPIS